MTPQEVQQYIEAVTKGLTPLGENVATGAKEYYALGIGHEASRGAAA